jgi:hypothetical protein
VLPDCRDLKAILVRLALRETKAILEKKVLMVLLAPKATLVRLATELQVLELKR